MKIILDANFLVYCAKQKLDYKERINEIINTGYGLVVPEQVILELNSLREKAEKAKDKQAAKLALQLLKVNKVKILKIPGKNADDAILNISKGNIIATLDRALRFKAERVITVSSEKKLRLI